jgi:Flp pilus assembly protein TadD
MRYLRSHRRVPSRSWQRWKRTIAWRCGTGALDAALTHLHALLLSAPTSPEAHHNLGVCLVQRGDHARAILAFEQAFRLQPVFFEARHNLVRALGDAMRLNEAEAQFARLIIDHPERVDPRGDLTTWLFRSRGDDVEALHRHGIALHRAGRLAEARQCFESVWRQRPDHAFAHCNLGQALAALGELTIAEQHLRTTVRLDPTVDTLGALATWLGQLGRHEEAVDTCRGAGAAGSADPIQSCGCLACYRAHRGPDRRLTW